MYLFYYGKECKIQSIMVIYHLCYLQCDQQSTGDLKSEMNNSFISCVVHRKIDNRIEQCIQKVWLLDEVSKHIYNVMAETDVT